MAQLYLPLRAPIVITDLRTAEMIKYASNAFLATKISFINEIANICEALGADVKEVAAGMGYDKRIGTHFLDAGAGLWRLVLPQGREGAGAHGARCTARNPQLLRAVMEINRDQRRLIVDRLRELLGDAGRQDDRPAGPGLQAQHRRHARCRRRSTIARMLLQSEGALVRAYDPVAMEARPATLPDDRARRQTPTNWPRAADALVVCTEWNEFKQLDLDRLRRAHAHAGHRRRPQHLRSRRDAPSRFPLPRRGPRLQRRARGSKPAAAAAAPGEKRR